MSVEASTAASASGTSADDGDVDAGPAMPPPMNFVPATPTPDTPSSAGAIELMQPFVDFNDISLQEKVGHGSYGVVYKAIWRDQFVAVKEFAESADQKAIQTEVKQLSRVRHYNIIALYGISAYQQSKYLIMEYAEGGSLHNFLHGMVKPYYSTAHAMSWARQCAEGVAYLHAMKPKPLIHRDLKPLNLLLTNKGRHLKICDFGTVVDKSTLMTNNKGSAAWMAPEVFESNKYTEKCDIFSWAIVLWEVLSRQQPFKESDNMYMVMWKIHRGERPPMIENCPEPIQKLMTSCWATVPDMRPSMQHVVNVMNELASFFPGADEPLDYEFVDQQIICAEAVVNYASDFSSFTASTNCTSSSQVTPTNANAGSHSNTSTASSSATPTNVAGGGTDLFQVHSNVPTALIAGSTRWDVIPEEPETSVYYTGQVVGGDATSRRFDTIRNGMAETGQAAQMPPLSVDVDPHAWDLAHRDKASSSAKSDGKERLTVTDTKPVIPHPPANATTMTTEQHAIHGNAQYAKSNLCYATNGTDADEDADDESDGTEQSLAEVLDPDLQPEQPIANNPESQEIYRQHRRLAKDYLHGITRLYYAQDFKEKLLIQMDPAERQEKQELLRKMNEKQELLELRNNLMQQLEKLQASGAANPVQLPAAGSAAYPPANTGDALPASGAVGAGSGAVATGTGSNSSADSTTGSMQNELMADDGWVVIAPNQNT